MDLYIIHLFYPLSGRHRKLEAGDLMYIHWLQGLLNANPTMFLDEIQDHLAETCNIEVYCYTFSHPPKSCNHTQVCQGSTRTWWTIASYVARRDLTLQITLTSLSMDSSVRRSIVKSSSARCCAWLTISMSRSWTDEDCQDMSSKVASANWLTLTINMLEFMCQSSTPRYPKIIWCRLEHPGQSHSQK